MQPPTVRAGSRAAARRALALPLLAAALAACSGGAAPAPSAAADSGIDVRLRDELVRLGMADQAARIGFDVETVNDTARMRALLAIDSSLTSRLRRIVAERGWPGRSLVGDEAANAAFLIVQHSPSDAFQREMLPVLEAAAETGEAEAADVAMLSDRVRTHEGRTQLYGTQFRIVDGALEPYPIDNLDSLDVRRARVGLLPMSEYVELLRTTYKGEVRFPPADSAAG